MCEIKFDRKQVAVIMQTSQTFAIKSRVRLRVLPSYMCNDFTIINDLKNSKTLRSPTQTFKFLRLHSKPNFHTFHVCTFQLRTSQKIQKILRRLRLRLQIEWDRYYYYRQRDPSKWTVSELLWKLCQSWFGWWGSFHKPKPTRGSQRGRKRWNLFVTNPEELFPC